MPASLIIEGMAQTAGLLIGEMDGFAQRVVLAKIGKAVFHRPAMPGDTLRYAATIADVKGDGALATRDRPHRRRAAGRSGVDVRLSRRTVSAAGRCSSRSISWPCSGRSTCTTWAATADGQPLELPPFYAEAERAAQAEYDTGRQARSGGQRECAARLTTLRIACR